MKFELFDLRLFVQVVDQSSLTRGAERCAISLPAASARIKHLEEAAGQPLLRRTSSGVQLTPAGNRLLGHARRICLQADHLAVDMQEFAADAQTHVRLMATTIAMAGDLPERIGRFVGANPKVAVDLVERPSVEITVALLEGRADLGVINESGVVDAFEHHPFGTDRLVLAVPRGHRLAGSGSVQFEQTLDERHIAMPVESSVGSVLTDVARAAGKERALATRVGSFESLCRLVEKGMGIGVLPLSCAQRYAGYIDTVTVELENPWAAISIRLVARNDVQLPHMARALFEYLKEGA